RLVDDLEADDAGAILVARGHANPHEREVALHRRVFGPQAIEGPLHAFVAEVFEPPRWTVVVRRRLWIGNGPGWEAVAAEVLGVHVLVEIEDRPDAARPGGVEEGVVALQEIFVVFALGGLDSGPREGDAHRVDAPSRGAI